MINNPQLLDQCSSVSKIQQPCSCSDVVHVPFNNENDIQFIHYNLYPVLFQYVDRFIQKEAISDSLVADLFFQMVKNDELNSDLEQMVLFSLKHAREICANYLNKDSAFLGELIELVEADFNEVTQKDLSLFTEMSPVSKELVFLKYGLGFDLNGISEILNLPYQDVALIYLNMNKKMLQ
ncbi:hypothetical protein [Pedobacter rhodius]|uniref:Sigma-70 family RNA polymerase sigma factor n=1 Tax=Pedobacter rhodius TaxID=3004098 RepID=A0ABT4L070_9SPHI|nr:hypothetical protein [Pedobacter sp. SJ11]MCZ4223483.1 hypothetical protein [Pedobacter sp. SJ11]